MHYSHSRCRETCDICNENQTAAMLKSEIAAPYARTYMFRSCVPLLEIPLVALTVNNGTYYRKDSSEALAMP